MTSKLKLCKVSSCNKSFLVRKFTCRHFNASCDLTKQHYLNIAKEIINTALFDEYSLNGIRVWLGVSKSDKLSVEIKKLYKYILESLGAIVIEDCDIDSFISLRTQYDALFMFSASVGIAARAVELVITAKFNSINVQTEKIYVYMPSRHKDGYIANKLESVKKYFYDNEQYIDDGMFKKSIRYLVNIASSKLDEERVCKMNPKPEILIVTALQKEFNAVEALLEHIDYDQSFADEQKLFPHGKVGKKKIVLCKSGMGNNLASVTASKMLNKYGETIKYILMVGIAGGVPNEEKASENVGLGDIVLSGTAGVIQYDIGKNTVDGFVATPSPRPPSRILLQHAERLVSEKYIAQWLGYLDDLAGTMNIKKPQNKEAEVKKPKIHIVAIGSGNQVVKNSEYRDSLFEKHNIKAVEMEGSGVADASWYMEKDYFIIRGICDLADPDKNKEWQEYAAAAAASFTKMLIEELG